MDVMNKSVFYYLPVMFLISGYFYFSHWTNQNWNEAVKFGQKVEYDEFGKQVTKLNVQEAQEDDFYIVIDSQKVRTFFKVLGKTKDNELAVQYGIDSKILPNTLNYNSYTEKNSYNFGNFSYSKVTNWVEEIINNYENFNERITLYSQDQLEAILCNNIVMGFTKNIENDSKNLFMTENLGWDLRWRFAMGDPLILLPIIFILFILFWIVEKLKKLYFTEKRNVFYYILAIFGITIFSYFFGNDLRGPTYNGGSDWYGIIYIFTSYVITYLLTAHFKQYFNNYNFAKRQFLYFFTIIFIGILCEIVIKSAVNYVFYTNNPSNEFKEGLSTTIFWIFTGSSKNWLMIATANFLNNLIGYISSLRRKSKQLQTVTSDAQISADALLQSEAHVNTHFLYNSLHAIAALAPVAADKTETLALSLAKYYRYTTNRNDEKWITIKEEVEALTSYLEVEKIRLGEKLTYAFDVSDDVSGVKIPKFLLQPLVENAVKYGYAVDKDTTNVKLSFHKLDRNILKISVCDSGISFGDHMEIGKGIRQVKDLLKRFYPEGHTISFVNEPVKCVEIMLKVKI